MDFYEIPGVYHSCNPHAILCVPHPYSKNRRTVTIFQTDTERALDWWPWSKWPPS